MLSAYEFFDYVQNLDQVPGSGDRDRQLAADKWSQCGGDPAEFDSWWHNFVWSGGLLGGYTITAKDMGYFDQHLDRIADAGGDEQDGLKIVLSPMQLAAILADATVDEQATSSNRWWGAAQVVGGALELVGAAALLTQSEFVAPAVGGAALAVHGADTMSAGLQQVWTGRPQTTMTTQAVAAAARSLGMDPATAGEVGMAVDIAVPFIAGFAGFVRVAEVRAGVMVLKESEGLQGARDVGHTIAKHVGKDRAYLESRLNARPRMQAASTFGTLNQAGLAVSKALKANKGAIELWARNAKAGEKMPEIHCDVGEVIGQGLVQSTRQMQNMTKVRIVLEKTANAKKIYFVLTAFPEL